MAAPIPEDSWIFILIMAAIILALLWNDGISRSSSSSSSKRTSSSSSSDSDTGSDTSPSDGVDTGGDPTDDIGDPVRDPTDGDSDDGSGGGRDPIIRVQEQTDDLNAAVKLTVEAFSRGEADIVATGITKMVNGPSGRAYIDVDSPENSSYVNKGSEYIFEESGLAIGPWQYQAWAKDSEGRTNTYINGFNLEPVGSPDDDDDDSGGGGPGTPSNPGSTTIEILNLAPSSGNVGEKLGDISVEIFSKAQTGAQLSEMTVTLENPSGIMVAQENHTYSTQVLRNTESLDSWLNQKYTLNQKGNYELKFSMKDSEGDEDSDYGTIVINKNTNNTSMPSYDISNDIEKEINELKSSMNKLSNLIPQHEKEVELETELKEVDHDLINKLEDVRKHEKYIITQISSLEDGSISPGEFKNDIGKHERAIHNDIVDVKNDLQVMKDDISQLKNYWEDEEELEKSLNRVETQVDAQLEGSGGDTTGIVEMQKQLERVIKEHMDEFRENSGENPQRDNPISAEFEEDL